MQVPIENILPASIAELKQPDVQNISYTYPARILVEKYYAKGDTTFQPSAAVP
jgi:hypothetical protein